MTEGGSSLVGFERRPLARTSRNPGGQGRNRTTDTRIFSPLLYQLSYLAAGRIIAALARASGVGASAELQAARNPSSSASVSAGASSAR